MNYTHIFLISMMMVSSGLVASDDGSEAFVTLQTEQGFWTPKKRACGLALLALGAGVGAVFGVRAAITPAPAPKPEPHFPDPAGVSDRCYYAAVVFSQDYYANVMNTCSLCNETALKADCPSRVSRVYCEEDRELSCQPKRPYHCYTDTQLKNIWPSWCHSTKPQPVPHGKQNESSGQTVVKKENKKMLQANEPTPKQLLKQNIIQPKLLDYRNFVINVEEIKYNNKSILKIFLLSWLNIF